MSFNSHKNRFLQNNYPLGYKKSELASMMYIIASSIYSKSTLDNSFNSIIEIIRTYYIKKYGLFRNEITDIELFKIYIDLEMKRNFTLKEFNEFKVYRKNQKKNNFRTMSKNDREKLNLLCEKIISLWKLD